MAGLEPKTAPPRPQLSRHVCAGPLPQASVSHLGRGSCSLSDPQQTQALQTQALESELYKCPHFHSCAATSSRDHLSPLISGTGIPIFSQIVRSLTPTIKKSKF